MVMRPNFSLRNAVLFFVLLVTLIFYGCAGITPDIKVNTWFAGALANMEPAVAAHPRDTNSLVAGAHKHVKIGSRIFTQVNTYYSTNGGAQWRRGVPLLISCPRNVPTSADPWIGANADRYVIGFIGMCRDETTGTIVGFSRAAYATSQDKGMTWSAVSMVSPEGGHADKTHVYVSDTSIYLSYLLLRVGEIKVFSSATGQTATVGFGYGPATVEVGGSPPMTYTTYIGYGNHLLVVPVVWENPLRIGTAVDLGPTSPHASPINSCDGSYYTVPGTRIRHIPVPQIVRGGTDGKTVYIVINDYKMMTNQFDLGIWHFHADTGPSGWIKNMYRYDRKHVIMPAIDWVKKEIGGAGNLVTTFYLASMDKSYLWDYVRLDLDDNANVVAGPMILNSTSPLDFFGTYFIGDYTNVTGRAPVGDGKIHPFAVWTDPRNNSARLECPTFDTVGTDIYGR